MTRVMRTAATGVATTTGGVLALIGAVAVPGMLFIAVLVALLAGTGGYALATSSAAGGPGHRFSDVVGCAVGGGVGVFAITGAATVIGSATVPLVLMGIAAAMWTVRHRLPMSGTTPDGALTDLTNAQLGRAWSSSHTRVIGTRDAAELHRLAALRRRQLDEIERRDPAGFRRWAGSTRWISAGSAPFLQR